MPTNEAEELAHLGEEPLVRDWVLSYPDTERVFIDAGANHGAYTLIAAERFRHVYAVEPHPYNIQRIKTRTAKLANVTVVGKALAATDEGQMLWESTHVMGHTTNRLGNNVHSDVWTGVPGVTFDTLWREIKDRGETVGVIKCDIEGAEAWAFDAASELLVENRPWLWVILESHNGVDWAALRRRFEDHGYDFPTEIKHAHHYLIRSKE
jgi:FkbM family methyltransferase